MIQNYDRSIFLAKNRQNMTHFFTYRLTKNELKNIQEGVITFMPIDYNFKKFLK
jgi:hypothetical protein